MGLKKVELSLIFIEYATGHRVDLGKERSSCRLK